MKISLRKSTGAFAFTAAAIVCLLGFSAMFASAIEIVGLVGKGTDTSRVGIAVALGVLVSGLGLVALNLDNRRAAFFSASVLFLIGTVGVVSFIFANGDPLYLTSSISIGRIPPIASICFGLTSAAILSTRHEPAKCVTIVIGAILASIAVAILLGFAAKAPESYLWGQFQHSSIQTGAAFFLVGTGLASICLKTAENDVRTSRLIAVSAAIGIVILTLGVFQAFEAQRNEDQRIHREIAASAVNQPAPDNLIASIILVSGFLTSLMIAGGLYQTLRLRQHSKFVGEINEELIRHAEENRLYERNLKASELLLKQFIRHSPAAVAMLDAEFRYLQVSEQWQKDYRLENQEIIGRSHFEVIPDIPERWKDICSQVLNDEVFRFEDDQFPRLDGTTDWLQWEARPWRTADGEIGGIILFSRFKTERKKIENELLELSQLQSTILDSANFSIISTAPDGMIRSLNRTASEWLGYQPEELIGRFTPTIIHDIAEVKRRAEVISDELGQTIKPSFDALVVKSRMTNRPDEDEWTYIRKDGGRFLVRLSMTALRDASGEITGYLCVGSDMPERRRAEATLRESEERFRHTFDKAPLAMAVIDLKGRWLQVNRALCKLVGYSEDELLALDHRDISHPEDLETERDFVVKLLAGRIDCYRIEKRLFHKDGQVLFVSLSVSLEKNHEGEPLYFIAQIEDITDRKRGEEELRASRARFAGILDMAEDGIISVNRRGLITIFNKGAERMFGYSADEVIGSPIEKVLPERPIRTRVHDAGESHERFIATAARQETHGLRSDGSDFPAEISVSTLELETETIRTAIVRDITNRKRMEQELKAAHDAALETVRMKSEFLANMSHEIRTPMNGIIGMTELLAETELTDAQSGFVTTVQSSAESLLHILGDILDFSKIEAGMLNFESVDFDLRSAVETVADLLGDRARIKNLELALVFQPDVPTKVCGDPTRLKQVLTNLIGNAVKFTEWGAIIVRVSKQFEDDDRVTLRFDVKDSGIGISEEAQKLLFMPFTQADSSITRQFGGTGLGLAISKQLVELMGGKISLHSAPGHGSTFIFTASFLKQPERVEAVMPGNADLKDVRILIVDDAPENRQILAQHAAGWRMNFEVAENATEALIKLRQAFTNGTPFELAVLDQNMPDMDGIDLARVIKADPTLADVELILIPSNGRRGDGRIAHEIGIRAYFSKPLSQAQLFECLTTVMSAKSESGKSSAGLITKHSLNEIKAAKSRVVLLVEDNAINQTVTLSQLAKSGYRIDIAANGQEALAAFKCKRYDAILMDCQMPIMDGYQATTEIRKREGSGRRTPIIAMTANAMTGDREKCIAAGMDEYIMKPVKRETLAAVLDRLLSNASDSSAEQLARVDFAQTPNAHSPVDFECLMDAASSNPEKARHLTELFIKFTSERLGELEDAIGRGSVTDVYSIAHKSLGSSRTLGMNAIVPALRELEVLGRAGEIQGLGEHLETAKSEFANIRNYLEDHFEAEFAAPNEVRSYV